MKLFNNETADERGQVGIGTLIIFIALVLVAAVAAGVLINTSGVLQSQAEDTGADARAQVSNHIDVISATGVVDSANGDVNDVELVVKKAAGADPIDLSEATVQYTSDTASATLTQAATANGTAFSVNDTDGSAASDTVLDTGEKLVITVSADDIEGTGIAAGEEVELQLVDQSGASSIYGVNVPDVLTGKDYVSV
ncbi:archaellin/type IV pilin N-terminal domain-containing protein [Halomarina pelagica]|uniref:archaellin/type IV pilin N-terminal domain-containing protein n=1 Tax=Halomarina pelagica TaxID=2961599 RepID=UPI0020C21723|nr:archaellin/type IV pilin N-terminal domain-containing protein [Halomarina sp. BND7]